MAYITTTQLEVFGQEIDALLPSGQTLIISAASRMFDKLCEVSDEFFEAAGAASDLTLYGDGTAYLKLPPYLSSPAPTIEAEDYDIEDDDWILQGQYMVWLSKTKRLSFDTTADRYTGWHNQVPVVVTARWGFTATPDDVKFAVTQIALQMFRTADPAFTAISQSGEANSAPNVPTQALEIANKYKMIYSTKAVF
jgi:hypothetical protein